MAGRKFDPNRLTFEQGIERIQKAIKKSGVEIEGRIVTSRDEGMFKLRELLRTDNKPNGFQKYQLPVALRCESQMFLTVAEPGAKAPRHAHKEGDGIRFIVAGSIIYDGKELTSNDWMFIPAGAPYSFEVGPHGATMFYCYCCCCA
ncbi:MAG TPA: cupin domain-containing protein [Thermodesulfobacteriota bacterium]|nr:cupin domain-containing protein [Thermodesulfobacteriota bacterium]